MVCAGPSPPPCREGPPYNVGTDGSSLRSESWHQAWKEASSLARKMRASVCMRSEFSFGRLQSGQNRFGRFFFGLLALLRQGGGKVTNVLPGGWSRGGGPRGATSKEGGLL